MVCERASDLQSRSKNRSENPTFSLDLPLRFRPDKPPRVKWVNWRWPRYEYDTRLPNVRASIQWVVHKGAVLEQLVIENSGDQPVDFQCRLPKDTSMKELNDLDLYSRHKANIRWCVPGPNGYGHVCVRDMGAPDWRCFIEVGNISSENDGIRNHGDCMMQPSEPGLARTAGTVTAKTNLNANDQVDTAVAAGFAEGDSKLVDKTDEHIKRTRSVAALTNLFVNGRAVKVQDDGDLCHEHTIGGSRNGSRGLGQETLEVIVAYKLISFPGGEVHWRNFLVATSEADVNMILREETDRLWRRGDIPSLCSLGLSVGGMMSMVNPFAEQSAGRDSIGNGKPEERKNSSHHIDSENKPNATLDTGSREDSLLDQADQSANTRDGAQKHRGSKSAGFSLPSGTPTQDSSPRSQIEYVAWRHLEYILSVCAIPVLSPSLLKDHSNQWSSHPCASHPLSWEEEIKEDDTPIALTCGDISGHRVCTSAS